MLCRPCARVRATLQTHRHALHWGIVHALPYTIFVLIALQTGQRAWYGAAIAAVWTALADLVGPVHARLRNMSILAVAGSLACGLGAFTSHNLPLALAAAAVVGLMVGLYGSQHSAVAQPAKLVFVAFLTSAGVPLADSAAALPAALHYGIGSMAAITCCLVLFPSEPDRRPRDEIIAMFSALAEFARLAATPDAAVHGNEAAQRYLDAKRQLRLAIEQARQAVHAVRLFGHGRSDTFGELVTLADACFRVGLLLAEYPRPAHAAYHPGPAQPDAMQIAIARDFVAAMEAADRQIRHALLPRQTAPVELRDRLAAALAPLQQHAVVTSLPSALTQALAALGQPLPAVSPSTSRHTAHTDADDDMDAPAWHLLLPRSARAALRRDAALPQHAIRLAAGGTAGLAIATLLLPGHGYWLAITLVIVLTPHMQTTRRSAWLRLAGSVAGAASAALLSWADVPPGAMAMLTPLFLAAAYGTRVRGQMGAFAFFLTLTVVYFSWLEHPLGSSLAFAVLRGIDTLLGCALALALVLVSPRPRPLAWLARHVALAVDAAALYVASAVYEGKSNSGGMHGNSGGSLNSQEIRNDIRNDTRRARTGLAVSLAEQALASSTPLAREHAAQLQQILLASRRLIGIGLRLQSALHDSTLDDAYRLAAMTLVRRQCGLLHAASHVLRRLPVAPLAMPGTLPPARHAVEKRLEDQLLDLAAVSSSIMRAVTVLEELREQRASTLAAAQRRSVRAAWLATRRSRV